MRKQSRSIKLCPSRTLEDNIHDYLVGVMKFYRYYSMDADSEAEKPNHSHYKLPEWIHCIEKQQWRDAIELAHRQGLIDAYDLSKFVMMLPNGDIIGPKPIA